MKHVNDACPCGGNYNDWHSHASDCRVLGGNYDYHAAEIRAAVEEERQAWVKQLKGEAHAAEAKLPTTTDRNECQYWKGFRDAANHAIRARGEEKEQ